MEFSELISATLGISPPWRVSHVTLDNEKKRLDITVTCNNHPSLLCPCCGAKGKYLGTKTDVWHHLDFFRYETFLHTVTPQLECCGRRHAAEQFWPRAGSKFVKLGHQQESA